MTPPTFIGALGGAPASVQNPQLTITGHEAGNLLLVSLTCENGIPVVSGISGGGLTWANHVTQDGGTDNSQVFVWSAVATSTADVVVTVSTNSASQQKSLRCSIWGGHDGVGAAAGSLNGGSQPSLNLVTTEDNSAVYCNINDWNAANGATRTWRTINATVAVETYYFRDPDLHTIFAGYWANTGAAGSKTVGMTAPSGQRPAMGVVEIKGLGGGGVNLTIADTVAVTDSVGRVGNASRTSADTVAATDSVGRVGNVSRTSADTVAAVDTLGRVSESARTIVDGLATTDAVEQVAASARAVTDSVAIADSVILPAVPTAPVAQYAVGTEVGVPTGTVLTNRSSLGAPNGGTESYVLTDPTTGLQETITVQVFENINWTSYLSFNVPLSLHYLFRNCAGTGLDFGGPDRTADLFDPGLILDHCTFNGQNLLSNVVGASWTWVINSDIRGGEDAWKGASWSVGIHSNLTSTWNGSSATPIADQHQDALQNMGTGHLHLYEMWFRTEILSGTSAFRVGAEFSNVVNVVLQFCGFSGGGHGFDLDAKTRTVTGVSVSDSKWVTDSFGFAPASAQASTGGSWSIDTWARNFETDGTPVTIQGQPTGAVERSITDAVSVADSVTRTGLVSRLVTSTVAVADTVSTGTNLTHSVTITDVVTVADSVTRIATTSRLVTGTVAVTDTVSAGTDLTHSVTITDAVSVADSVTRTGLVSRLVTSTVAVTDLVSRSGAVSRGVLDTVLTVDDLGYASVFVRTSTDTLAVADLDVLTDVYNPTTPEPMHLCLRGPTGKLQVPQRSWYVSNTRPRMSGLVENQEDLHDLTGHTLVVQIRKPDGTTFSLPASPAASPGEWSAVEDFDPAHLNMPGDYAVQLDIDGNRTVGGAYFTVKNKIA